MPSCWPSTGREGDLGVDCRLENVEEGREEGKKRERE